MSTVIAAMPPPPPAYVEIAHLAPHPRLWVSSDGRANTPSVNTLRTRAQDPGAARAWSVIEESSGIQYRALVYLLTGNGPDLAEVVEQFRPVRDPHRLAAQALAYDWLYPSLDEAQRQELARLLLDSADAAWERNYARLPEFLHNIPNTATAAQCLAALAAADELPDRAQSVFDRGWRYQREIPRCTSDGDANLDRLNPIYPLAGGGWPEGHDYDRHGTLEALELWLALRSAGGPDFVSGS
ncbi:MAG: hypothetical protein MUQ26_01225, partial [Armatimonadetes bacterium]|nr:hypothetical protein [Armatimonadota bacterium]